MKAMQLRVYLTSVFFVLAIILVSDLISEPVKAAASVDVEQIKQKVRETAAERQKERQAEQFPAAGGSSTSANQDQSGQSRSSVSTPAQVIYSWLNGRVVIRKIAGQLYLSFL